ncbi:MAG: hypothetical protein KAS05_00575 [Candidatus Omnitrophica bacterium]|nr:hypothetical protein [Candidatus Omnitrophota bacterium]
MCHVVSIVAAAATSLAWKKSKNIKILWLTLMFCGGAMFGIIDHLWNGELFLISANTPKDLILGVLIVATTTLLWAIILLLDRLKNTSTKCVDLKN